MHGRQHRPIDCGRAHALKAKTSRASRARAQSPRSDRRAPDARCPARIVRTCVVLERRRVFKNTWAIRKHRVINSRNGPTSSGTGSDCLHDNDSRHHVFMRSTGLWGLTRSACGTAHPVVVQRTGLRSASTSCRGLLEEQRETEEQFAELLAIERRGPSWCRAEQLLPHRRRSAHRLRRRCSAESETRLSGQRRPGVRRVRRRSPRDPGWCRPTRPRPAPRGAARSPHSSPGPRLGSVARARAIRIARPTRLPAREAAREFGWHPRDL